MVGQETTQAPAAGCPRLFATTHWSVVLAAAREDSAASGEALEQLCRTYWYPLYLYVRWRGYSREDAEDLTQDFFAHIMSGGVFERATPERGKFRSFLLASLQHFLIDQHRRATAGRRGGGRRAISIDADWAEERLAVEPREELSPERLYERAWAMTLLDRAQSRLRAEYAAAGRLGLYERLEAFPLAGKSDQPFEEGAAELGMTVGALKSAVHRMRARYRKLVGEEVAHTVGDPSELKEEARFLIAVVSG